MKTNKEITQMFFDDIRVSIVANDGYKSTILESVSRYYNKEMNTEVMNGGWSMFNINSALDNELVKTDESLLGEVLKHGTDVVKKKFLDKQNVKTRWNTTRKLGEPLIANVSMPFIEGKKRISIDSKTSRNSIKADVLSNMLNYFDGYSASDRNMFYKTISRKAIVEGTVFFEVFEEESHGKMSIEIPEDTYKAIKGRPSKDPSDIKVSKRGDKYFIVDNDMNEKKLRRRVCDATRVHLDPYTQDMADKVFFCNVSTMRLEEIALRYGTEHVPAAEKVLKFWDDSSINSHGYFEGVDVLTVFDYWRKEMNDDDSTGNMYHYVIFAPKCQGNMFLYEGDNEIHIAIKEESPYSFNRIPFTRVIGFDSDNGEWGDSLASFTAELEDLENDIISSAVENMKSAVTNKWIVKGDAFDEVNMDKLQNGDSIVELKNRFGGSAESAVHQGKFTELPSSVFRVLDIISSQSKQTVGVNEAMLGNMNSGVRAPTSNFKQGIDLAQVRASMIISNIKEGVIDGLELWGDMVSTGFSQKQIKKITNIDYKGRMVKNAKDKVQSLLQGVEIEPEQQELLEMEILKYQLDEYRDTSIKFDFDVLVASEASVAARVDNILRVIREVREIGGILPENSTRKLAAELTSLHGLTEISEEILGYTPQLSPNQQAMDELALAKEAEEVEALKKSSEKDAALTEAAIARAENLRSETQMSPAMGNAKARKEEANARRIEQTTNMMEMDNKDTAIEDGGIDELLQL